MGTQSLRARCGAALELTASAPWLSMTYRLLLKRASPGASGEPVAALGASIRGNALQGEKSAQQGQHPEAAAIVIGPP